VWRKKNAQCGTWIEACISTTCTAEVPKLIHKKEYLFLVRAKFHIRESEPWKTSTPIIAKNPFNPHGMNLEKLKKLEPIANKKN